MDNHSNDIAEKQKIVEYAIYKCKRFYLYVELKYKEPAKMSSCRVLENLCTLSNIMLSLPPVVSYKVSFRSFKNASGNTR